MLLQVQRHLRGNQVHPDRAGAVLGVQLWRGLRCEQQLLVGLLQRNVQDGAVLPYLRSRVLEVPAAECPLVGHRQKGRQLRLTAGCKLGKECGYNHSAAIEKSGQSRERSKALRADDGTRHSGRVSKDCGGRLKGVVNSWNEEWGFGFIRPDAGVKKKKRKKKEERR